MNIRASIQIAALLTLTMVANDGWADSFNRVDTSGSAGGLHEAAGTFVPVFDDEGKRTEEVVFLLHGGYPPELDAQPLSDVWVLADGYWQHITSQAPAMAGHTLVEGADGRAWAVGAIGPDGWTAPMTELFTFEVHRAHGALDVVIDSVQIPGAAPNACFGATAVAADGGRSIITVGGTCLGNPLDPDPGELWEYRIDDNRWTRRADMPVAISDHTTVVARDFIWVFGGSVSGDLGNRIYRFDLLSDTWAEVAADGERPAPRRDHRAVAAGRHMLVFGGIDGSLPPDIDTLDDVWQLDLDELFWTEKTPMPTGLAAMTVELIPRRVSASRMFEVMIYGGVVDAWSFPYELSEMTSVYTSDVRAMRTAAPIQREPRFPD
jgi:hypothetical protein